MSSSQQQVVSPDSANLSVSNLRQDDSCASNSLVSASMEKPSAEFAGTDAVVEVSSSAEPAEEELTANKPSTGKSQAKGASDSKIAAKPKPAVKKPAVKKPEAAASNSLKKTSVSDEVVIKFDHVTKVYNLYKNDRGRLLGFFNIKKKGVFLGSVEASKDLSFEIKKGEAVAFIGCNGAGKSTALKMVTGVTHPTMGEVTVNGRVSALLELTAGFDNKLTGRENIALRGQILGMNVSKIKEIEPAVVEFADLGLYIDQPMRTYSSGMRARLGFAFAVAVQPDILVVDEALSVGDRIFRKKCLKRVREIMMDENVTVLFVTHSSSTAKEFCSRGIVLDHGSILYDGGINEAIAFYDKMYDE